MQGNHELRVSQEYSGTRIDKFVHELQGLSRAFVKDLIEQKLVLVDEKVVKASFKLKENQCVTLSIPEPETLDLEAQNLPLDIVYEDDDLLVLNKAVGMITHPAPGVYKDTLVNALLFHFQGKLSEINGVLRPGIVHRLDKDTSGLILVAKNNLAHESLAEQIQNKTCKRIYQCLVQGKFKAINKVTEINKAIGRDPNKRNKMSVIVDSAKKSRTALTYVTLLDSFRFKEKDFSLLQCELKTGRTHQIRVHLSFIKHPILGDELYGASKKNGFNIARPLLHAKKISFLHPRTQKLMSFEIDLPEDFQNSLKLLSTG